MTPPIALVTAEWPTTGTLALTGLGLRVATAGWAAGEPALDPAGLTAAAADASVLIVEVETIDDAVLDALPGLEVVAAARGTPSNVDIDACTRRRIPVLHAPARNADSVADFTIGLIVCCCRGICAADRRLRAQGWLVDGQAPYWHFRGPELAGRTLGLIGCGAVGERVAARAALGLGMRIIHYDPARPAVPHSAAVGLAELLRTSDVVSLHCTRSAQARGMIGPAEIAALKPASYLINTAGGAMVDEKALVHALETGRIAGAALDVFADEPLPADSPLLRCPDLVLTPHLAGAARDVPRHHAQILCDDLGALCAGRAPAHCVNAADVLPITPPPHFAAMRATGQFLDGRDGLAALGSV